MPWAEYNKIKQIGSGAQTKIFHCKLVKNGKSIVVKEYNKCVYRVKGNIPGEVYILRNLLPPHPNILEFLDWKAGPDETGKIQFEYYRGGDLEQFVRREGESVDFIWNVFAQVSRAIAFLHGRRIIHGDVKPDNVFLREGYQEGCKLPRLVLGDFDIAFVGVETRNYIGTAKYQAPEYPVVSAATDVWGLGAIIHALGHGRAPIDDINLTITAEAIDEECSTKGGTREEAAMRISQWITAEIEKTSESKKPEPLPKKYPAILNRRMMECLTLNPKERFDSEELFARVIKDTNRKNGALIRDTSRLETQGSTNKESQIVKSEPNAANKKIALQKAEDAIRLRDGARERLRQEKKDQEVKREGESGKAQAPQELSRVQHEFEQRQRDQKAQEAQEQQQRRLRQEALEEERKEKAAEEERQRKVEEGKQALELQRRQQDKRDQEAAAKKARDEKHREDAREKEACAKKAREKAAREKEARDRELRAKEAREEELQKQAREEAQKVTAPRPKPREKERDQKVDEPDRQKEKRREVKKPEQYQSEDEEEEDHRRRRHGHERSHHDRVRDDGDRKHGKHHGHGERKGNDDSERRHRGDKERRHRDDGDRKSHHHGEHRHHRHREDKESRH